MALAQPPGCRSCRNPDGTEGSGGEWTHCSHEDETGHSFLSDIDNELNASNMAESDLHLFRRELLNKMRKAEQGRLRFGPMARNDDVYELERSRNELLELRHTDVTTVDDSGSTVIRLSRLYFTERASRPAELLAIAFFTKAPGPIGLEEQDSHIDAALGRLLSHETRGR